MQLHPESLRNVASAVDLCISLKAVCWAARVRPEAERRAMIWLGQFANRWPRIRKIWDDRDLTPPLELIGAMPLARIASELRMEPSALHACLTNPDTDRAEFIQRVNELRARFEAAIPPHASTEASQVVDRAFHFTLRRRRMSLCLGKWRTGKTSTAELLWLRNLDRAVWLDTPAEAGLHSFYRDLTASLGIGRRTMKAQVSRIVSGITECFGLGLIEMIVCDEAHDLWPNNPGSKPERLEFIRRALHDGRSIGVLMLTTEQFSQRLSEAQSTSSRYAPGQAVGRWTTFDVPDALSDADLLAIAKLHCPEGTPPPVLQGLRAIAKDSEGYVGAMIGVIQKVRGDALPHVPIPAAAWLKAIEEEKAYLDRQKKRMAQQAQTNIVAFKRTARRKAA